MLIFWFANHSKDIIGKETIQSVRFLIYVVHLWTLLYSLPPNTKSMNYSVYLFFPARQDHSVSFQNHRPMHNKYFTALFITLLISANSVYSQVTPGDSIHAAKYVIELEDVNIDDHTIKANTSVSVVPLVDNLDIIQLQLMELTVDSVFVNMHVFGRHLHIRDKKTDLCICQSNE